VVIRALDRKLLRDLSILRGQVITISLVVAAGIASWICLRSAYTSLLVARDSYYARERFGDVFASVERAPASVASRLEVLPGIAAVYPRLVEAASLPVDFLVDPAIAQIISLPEDGVPPINGVVVTEGRLPDPARDDEVLLLEAFAARHGVRPGAPIPAILEGARRELRVVGLAMSPEHVFAIGGGSITVDDRFAVLWMTRGALGRAFHMEGAFDDVAIRLQPGASEESVIADVDRVLAPYGGRGAVGRRLQSSSYFVEGELAQLSTMATFAPAIFLAVAAFLLNVVLARLVQLQRAQIATLKAVGYRDLEIGLHYLELVVVMVAIGAVIGVGAGAWLGRGMTALYGEYFRFPGRVYVLTIDVVAVGVLASLAAAIAGALGTVRGVIALPPAEAMRPPAPARYKSSWLSRSPLVRLFETSGRMILREIERRPLRVIVSSAAVAMAIAILVVGRFMGDALENLIEQQFQRAMREDVAVTFTRALPERAIRDLAHLPGVERVEGIRQVPVHMRLGARSRDAVLLGHRDEHVLRALVDTRGAVARVPHGGIVLTRTLAEILGAEVGGTIELEVEEGARLRRSVRVVGVVDEPYGLWGHMHDDALHALLGEQRRVSLAVLRIDAGSLPELRRRLRELPMVMSVTRRQAVIDQFREQSGQSMTTMTIILTIFASIIAIGVVYNNARIVLASRARDLASLRVLGFTRAEISAVLLGELGIQVVLAIPIGLGAGTWMARALMATNDPERYRMVAVISPATYAFATVVALAAALVSALLVRRRLDRLDLVGVLKTRE
jgi:putative ABC transport system permease protein